MLRSDSEGFGFLCNLAFDFDSEMTCSCHNHEISDSEDSDGSSIEELPPANTTIRLEDIKTLRQLYAEPDDQTLKLRPVDDPEFPFNDKLLDFVSLVLVIHISTGLYVILKEDV